MAHSVLKSALLAALFAPLLAVTVSADEVDDFDDEEEQVQQVIHFNKRPAVQPTYGQVPNGVPFDAYGAGHGYNYDGCYPPIRASLYPCPKADVPREVGYTVITSPALSPHEMLYAHEYRALYPPYYYKNPCGLACLPFMPKCKLKGTEVKVKYHSCSWWRPPVSRVCYKNRQFR